jgi:predicted DCC family thiol-disulfide oxidoreductase YuxK
VGVNEDPVNSPTEGGDPRVGWILYDATCGICRRWVPFWEPLLRRNGYAIAPLQAPWARARFAMGDAAYFRDLRLLLTDGGSLAGADVYRHVMRRVWWARPLYWLSLAPLLRWLFDAAYRKFADNRHRFSESCGLGANP